MLSNSEIEAASSTLSEVSIANLVSTIRTSDRYKKNPAYFVDLQTKIENLEGTVQAKQINAVLTRLEALGVGMVELNQSQTVGTDGLIYSKKSERDSLIDYALNVMYEELFTSSTIDDSGNTSINGDYGVGRLPLDYKGYL